MFLHGYNYPERSSCFLSQGTVDAGVPLAPPYSLTTYHFCASSWPTDFQPPTHPILCVNSSSAYPACSVSLQNRKCWGINTYSPSPRSSSQHYKELLSLPHHLNFPSTNVLVVCHLVVLNTPNIVA